MQVAVIDHNGHIIATGNWDGKSIDGFYGRVDAEIYNLAYMYRAEHGQYVSQELQRQHQEEKALKDKHGKHMYEMRNQFGAR